MLNFFDPQTTDEGTQSPKFSVQSPKDFLLNYAKRVNLDVESQEARIRYQTMIQMCRRHRGTTPSDRFGYWKNNVWAESPKFDALHCTNIFQSLVRGAEANYYQAQLKLDVSAKAGTFVNRSIERISRGIYEVLGGQQWTPDIEQEIFFSATLKKNAWIVSRFNKSKDGIKLQKPNFSKIGYEQSGTAICPDCDTSHPYTSDTAACPECGSGNLSVMDSPTKIQDSLVSGFSSIPAGESEMIVVDGFDMSVDDTKGTPSKISSGGWAEWRYFVQKSELQRVYDMKCVEKAHWSYPTRLKMAFKRYQAGETGPTTDRDKDTYELRQIWMDLAEYQDYVAPSDWQCGSFEIKRGQRFADINTEGMVFAYSGTEIAFVDNEAKNERVKGCHWLADSISVYGLGVEAGLPLQRKINILDNMAMEGEARSMKGSVAYVPEAVDGAHLEGSNTNVPLRPDFVTNGEPLKNFLMPIDVSGLSQSSLAYLGRQADAMQRVMGVPDVTLGEGDPSARTASGQGLIDRNATGLLIPAKLSEGNMRVGWLWDQLLIIQKYYPLDAVRQFGARYGEEWLDDEIQAFLDGELKKAITIRVVEGSEVPESRYEKQQKLRADIGNGFIPMTPSLQATLARQSGYDGIDVGFYESNRKLGQKRYNWLKESVMPQFQQLEQAYQTFEQKLTDPATGQRQEDGMGNVVMNPVIGQLVTAPQLVINEQAENLSQQYEFWQERTRDLMASSSDQPAVMVAVCDAMMTRYQMATFKQMAKAQSLQALSATPAAGHMAAAANAGAPPEQGPPPPPPEPTPQQKVAESMSYKDVPPELQKAIAADAGHDQPLSVFQAHAKLMAPKVAPKPVLKAKAKAAPKASSKS